MGGWSYCPYEMNFFCRRLKRDCDPGIPGCVLFGRIERDDLDSLPKVVRRRRPARKDTEDGSPAEG